MTDAEFAEFKHKQLILASSVSPDNGSVVPWPTRTCSFIPTNIPIIVGMLTSPQTMVNIVLWQWINQTYNAGLNYGNRNASSEQTTSDLLKAYSIAVSSAITMALGMRKVADFMLKGRTGAVVALSVNACNYTAVTISSCTNTYVMRLKELDSGIMVKDKQTGEEFGMSQNAASEAITSTLQSRVFYIVPIFFVPFFWNMAVKKANLMPKPLTAAAVAVEAVGVAIGLYIAMPLNCALHP
jgi:sideroflexin-5